MTPSSARLTCEEFDAAVDELAVGGIAEPHRSALLRHAAGCPSCDARLRALADVADRLLLLAPTAEPPAGFESRVLERIGLSDAPAARRAHRGRRWLAVGVAAAIIGGVVLTTRVHDRAPVTPSAVATGAIVSTAGAPVGVVRLVDEPRPHILLVIDHPQPAAGERSCELDLDGQRVVVGSWTYHEIEGGLWAVGIDRGLLRADSMRILGPDGSVIATALLHRA